MDRESKSLRVCELAGGSLAPLFIFETTFGVVAFRRPFWSGPAFRRPFGSGPSPLFFGFWAALFLRRRAQPSFSFSSVQSGLFRFRARLGSRPRNGTRSDAFHNDGVGKRPGDSLSRLIGGATTAAIAITGPTTAQVLFYPRSASPTALYTNTSEAHFECALIENSFATKYMPVAVDSTFVPEHGLVVPGGSPVLPVEDLASAQVSQALLDTFTSGSAKILYVPSWYTVNGMAENISGSHDISNPEVVANLCANLPPSFRGWLELYQAGLQEDNASQMLHLVDNARSTPDTLIALVGPNNAALPTLPPGSLWTQPGFLDRSSPGYEDYQYSLGPYEETTPAPGGSPLNGSLDVKVTTAEQDELNEQMRAAAVKLDAFTLAFDLKGNETSGHAVLPTTPGYQQVCALNGMTARVALLGELFSSAYVDHEPSTQ